MNTPEHLLTCLAEEGVEVALEMSKLAHKSLRFGLDDRNVLNPTGPNNRERLVDELNDLQAVIEMCMARGIIPIGWQDAEKIAAKKVKVLRFMDHAKNVGALKP